MFCHRRSQWPHGLRCGSVDARLLGLWVRIPPGAWMSVYCDRCVLSGRGLCVRMFTRPGESYRVWWCVWVWSWILDNEEALAQWELLRHCKISSIIAYVHMIRMTTTLKAIEMTFKFFLYCDHAKYWSWRNGRLHTMIGIS